MGMELRGSDPISQDSWPVTMIELTSSCGRISKAGREDSTLPKKNRQLIVFIDGHTFDAGWQGTTTYLAGILNALPAAMARVAPDVDLRLVCSGDSEDNIRRHVSTNFQFMRVGRGFVRRNCLDIPLALRATHADVVISQYVRPFFAPCLTFSVIHDVLFLDFPKSFSWAYKFFRKVLFKWSARRSSFICTVSKYSAERIANHFGLALDRIDVIPNGIDPAFSSVKAPPRRIGEFVRLLSVSRLERRKRHEWGIAAQEALAVAGIKSEYTIIGSGDDAYAMELREAIESARQRGLAVEIRSRLGFNELIDAYAMSDVFLFPAEAEGFGIPVIEASGVGLPCVVSNGGALNEFRNVFVGESFPAHDKDAFVEAVLKVARNHGSLRDEAEQQRHVIAAAYCWPSAADKFARILKTIADSKK